MSAKRLEEFFAFCSRSIYAEPVAEPHITITNEIVSMMFNQGLVSKGAKVLDVGCGTGQALDLFIRGGADAVGITLGADDLQSCRDKGLPVHEMDQNNLDFPDDHFDLVFARHVLEHSPIPLFTLFEYRRVLRRGGWVYVEVPAPDTFAHHEWNVNHYSVFTPSVWLALFHKAGLVCESYQKMDINMPSGADVYYNFFLEKRQES